MRARTLLGASAALAIALAANAGTQKPQCKLMRIDEWKVQPDVPQPVLMEGFVNGRSVPVLLDTGMGSPEGALLESAAARQLGVPVSVDAIGRFAGLGGETQARVGIIRWIKIGQATRRDWHVLVGGEDHGHRGTFIIGNAFFQDIDLELDLPQNTVRLFKSSDCRGMSLAYWAAGRAGEVRMWVEGHIHVEVMVNGKRVNAILDSGAGTTLLDMALAQRLGVTKDSSGTQPGRCFWGFGKDGVSSWRGQFESFTIGDQTIRNPRMYFADLRVPRYHLPEMILGADFLRAHRVMIARRHGKLFFTYTGGTVFPERPSQPCT